MVDRWGVLLDVWECENEFTLAKARLIDIYLEMYEHCLVRAEQHKICERILTLIQLRPYIDLDSWGSHTTHSKYLAQCYALHTKMLVQQYMFYRQLVDWQIAHEKTAASRWYGHDWRLFMHEDNHHHHNNSDNKNNSNSNNVDATNNNDKHHMNTSNVQAAEERQKVFQRKKEMDAIQNARKKKKHKQQQQSLLLSVKHTSDKHKNVYVESDSDDSEPEQSQPADETDDKNTSSTTTTAENEPVPPLPSQTILQQLCALQIANSPSPFCRTFRVGMLDFLPSIVVLLDIDELLTSACQQLSTCIGDRPIHVTERMCLYLAVLQQAR